MSDVLTALIVERRGSPRRRTLLAAQIIYCGGICSMSGQILNISDTGALLRPVDIPLCPNKFVLRSRSDPPRDCEVIWRNGEVLGVRFVPPEPG